MMVWFNAASSAVSISPKKMVRTSAWLTGVWVMAPAAGAAGLTASAGGAGAVAAAASAGVMRPARRSGALDNLAALPEPPRTPARTVARTLERARAATREKFISGRNPERTSRSLLLYRIV